MFLGSRLHISHSRLGVVTAAWLLAGSWCAAAPAVRAGDSATRVASPFRVVAAAAGDSGVTVALDGGAVERLRVGPKRMKLALPVSPTQDVMLELERFEVTTDLTKFIRATPDGRQQVARPDVVLLRGTVSGDPDSHVFLAMSDRGITNGIVRRSDGDTYFVSAGRGPRGGTSNVTIHRAGSAAGFPDQVPFCGTDDSHNLLGDVTQSLGGVATVGVLPGSPYLIKVAVEGDQAFVNLFGGNVAAAEAYIVELIGAVSDIYRRDFDVRLRLDFVRTWPAGGEPFGADDLSGFASYWIANENPSSYHIVHLMSGRRDMAYGGIAYVSGPCGDAYSIGGYLLGSFPTPVDGPDLGNWDLSVVAHEMGHNMGTGHTHDSYTPPIDSCAYGAHKRGTIMSYCHTTAGGMLNTDMRFHSRVQDTITNILATSSCVFLDCNENGLDDFNETSFGLADDVNSNHIPDECEDCDSNGTLDSDDILAGAADVDGNGIPDVCGPDCNGNVMPDEWEIAQGLAADANDNRVPDDCEPDCDGNGTADHVDIDLDSTLDLDRNAVLDACQDCDGNGQSDWLDLQRQGNIYVADRGGFVREFHVASGVAVQDLAVGAVDDPQGIAFDAERRLYVSSYNDDRVVRVDVETGATTDFVPTGVGGLDGPTALLFTPGGNLLVASKLSSAVLEYDGNDGTFLGSFVGSGSGGLSGPYGLTYGPSGDLYVADGNNSVRRYDGATGLFVGTLVSSGGGGLNGARDLAFLPDGRLLVSSYYSGSVLQYDDTGTPLGVFSVGPEPTGAWGLHVKDDGGVYVARGTGDVRIIEYGSDGLYIRSFIRADGELAAPTMFAIRPPSPTDCDQNLILDECDVFAGAPDCNGNLTPDACDLANSALNADGDDEVDSCQCASTDAPTAVAGAVPRNRYLPFAPPVTPNGAVALRVTLFDLPAPFDAANGATYFVQAPELIEHPLGDPFWAATLGCDPVYLDWTPYDAVELTGQEIVPSAVYTVQALDQGCETLDEGSYSVAATALTASAWGDIIEPFAEDGVSAQPDFNDVGAAVDAFLQTPNALPLMRADIHPGVPNKVVDFNDIAMTVDGFLGTPYPFAGPTVCP